MRRPHSVLQIPFFGVAILYIYISIVLFSSRSHAAVEFRPSSVCQSLLLSSERSESASAAQLAANFPSRLLQMLNQPNTMVHVSLEIPHEFSFEAVQAFLHEAAPYEIAVPTDLVAIDSSTQGHRIHFVAVGAPSSVLEYLGFLTREYPASRVHLVLPQELANLRRDGLLYFDLSSLGVLRGEGEQANAESASATFTDGHADSNIRSVLVTDFFVQNIFRKVELPQEPYFLSETSPNLLIVKSREKIPYVAVVLASTVRKTPLATLETIYKQTSGQDLPDDLKSALGAYQRQNYEDPHLLCISFRNFSGGNGWTVLLSLLEQRKVAVVSKSDSENSADELYLLIPVFSNRNLPQQTSLPQQR
jgi:hypothetical protein